MSRTSWACKLAAVGTVVAMVWSVNTGCAALDAAPTPSGGGNSPRELGEPYNWTLLHIAAREGTVEKARALLEQGADLEAREHIGRTPLHIAVMWGQLDMTAFLLERGADVNARDIWDVTPLRRLELLRESRGFEYDDIADLLRNHGGVK